MGLLRRIYRSPELFQLLATFGVVLMVQDAALAIWGPDDLTVSRPPWLRAFVRVLGDRFPVYDLVLIAIGPVVLGLLWLAFTRTRWGRLVRAATADREMVSGPRRRPARAVHLRLRARRRAGRAGRGAGAAGRVGQSRDGPVRDHRRLRGRRRRRPRQRPGAYLASLLIGLLQAFGIVLIPKATLVLVFVVMAVVLVLRPNGLLGRPGEPSPAARSVVLVQPPSRAMLIGWAALALLGAAMPLLAGPYTLSILTEAMVAVLFAASLHFMMGPGGMPSFGHAAWFGIGAYAAGLSAQALAAPMPLGLLLAPLAAGAVAALFGAFVVRLSGVYLAMLTLAFAQIVWAVAFQWVGITGGDNGILGVWPPGWASGPAAYYLLALLLCGGGAALLQRVLASPYGYALRAARDSPLRAEAIGLDTQRIRLAAFVIAGAAAGLSGAVFAYQKGSVFPGFVSIPRSVDALLMVLLGGVQTMAGPIVGALAYTGLYDGLLRMTELWRLVLGAAIVHAGAGLPGRHRRRGAALAAANAMTALAVDGLRKAFGGLVAVDGVSFAVAAGEMLALIGPNGAGKSTCFNMVGGQLRPDAGHRAAGRAGHRRAAARARSAAWASAAPSRSPRPSPR